MRRVLPLLALLAESGWAGEAERRRRRGRPLSHQRLHVMLCVRIEKAADHALVLRIVFRGLAFEKFHAALAERQSDFHAFVAKHQILGTRKESRKILTADDTDDTDG